MRIKDRDTDVKIEEHELVTIITSPKFKIPFTIQKAPGGNMFFEVIAGSVKAKQINGFFTSAEEAKREVLKYIRQSPDTKAVRRDKNWKENHGSRKVV